MKPNSHEKYSANYTKVQPVLDVEKLEMAKTAYAYAIKLQNDELKELAMQVIQLEAQAKLRVEAKPIVKKRRWWR